MQEVLVVGDRLDKVIRLELARDQQRTE
jgi:hypothetical protein